MRYPVVPASMPPPGDLTQNLSENPHVSLFSHTCKAHQRHGIAVSAPEGSRIVIAVEVVEGGRACTVHSLTRLCAASEPAYLCVVLASGRTSLPCDSTSPQASCNPWEGYVHGHIDSLQCYRSFFSSRMKRLNDKCGWL